MWVNLTINNVRKEERKKSFTVIEIKRSLFWGLLSSVDLECESGKGCESFFVDGAKQFVRSFLCAKECSLEIYEMVEML